MRAQYERNDHDNYEAVHIQDDSGSTVAVMRGLTFDEQDRELGQDRYSLVQDTGATVYGGIDMWVIDAEDHGWLYLSPEAEEVLDSESDAYEITLPPDQLGVVHRTVSRFLELDGGDIVDRRTET